MKRLTILTVLLSLAACMETFAQYHFNITGNVNDGRGEALTGAQIYIYQKDSLISMSKADAKGHYATAQLPAAWYYMEVSCLGYETVADSVLLVCDTRKDFTLKETALALDSVTVYGERGRQKADGYTFHLSEKARKCGNPFMALQEIPLLISDPAMETVRAADGASMAILVDGMIVNSGISPIDPSRIKSVEIYDVVSAKYLNMGYQKVMDIRLRDTGCYFFHQNAERIDLPTKYGFVLEKFEVGNRKLSFYAELFPSYTRRKTATDYSMQSGDFSRSYSGESMSEAFDLSYQAMLKWKPGENDNLVISTQGDVDKTLSSTPYAGRYAGLPLEMRSRSKYIGHVYDISAYYRHTFRRGDTFEANASYTDNRSRNTADLNQSIGGDATMNNQSYRAYCKTARLALDYDRELSENSSFQVGSITRYITDNTTNTGLLSGERLFRHWNIDETFYIGLHGMLARNLSYYASVGVDYTYMHFSNGTKEYLNPHIDTKITWMVSKKWRLMLNYAIVTASPNISILNPYNTSADTLLQSSGNPDLVQQKTHGVAARLQRYWGRTNYGLHGFLSYNIDNIMHKYSTDENGVLNTVWANEDHKLFFGGGVFYNYSYGKFMLGANMNYTVNHYNKVGNKDKLSMSMEARWFPNRKFMFYTQADYTNHEYTDYTKFKQFTPNVTVGTTYYFTNNMYLRIALTNILGDTRSKMTCSVDGYRSVEYKALKNFTPMILFRWTIRKNDNKRININGGSGNNLEKSIRL